MIIEKIRETNTHIPKMIMAELLDIDPSPRYTSLKLYVQYNYPEYDNEEDISFIWDHAFESNERLLMFVNN